MVLYYFDIHREIFYFEDRLVIPLLYETAVVLLANQNLKTDLLGYGYRQWYQTNLWYDRCLRKVLLRSDRQCVG